RILVTAGSASVAAPSRVRSAAPTAPPGSIESASDTATFAVAVLDPTVAVTTTLPPSLPVAFTTPVAAPTEATSNRSSVEIATAARVAAAGRRSEEREREREEHRTRRRLEPGRTKQGNLRRGATDLGQKSRGGALAPQDSGTETPLQLPITVPQDARSLA